MDQLELAEKLNELRISQKFDHVELLISKLVSSSYVSHSTRCMVIDLLNENQTILQFVHDHDLIAVLVATFSRPVSYYIPRATIRQTIMLMREFKKSYDAKRTISVPQCTEEWFYRLVDNSEATVVTPLREVFDALDICRYYLVSSSYKIVVFGKKDKEDFFKQLISKCSLHNDLKHLSISMAENILNYHGGVVIESSSDCERITAGNNMTLVIGSCFNGTDGVFFEKLGTIWWQLQLLMLF